MTTHKLQYINYTFLFQESLLNKEIEDDLTKELLDNGMFIKLVSTPIYSSIINFILNREASETDYTMSWATNELVKANYLAEAGHLHLMSIGVPASLRGFSQSFMYVKNMLK